MSALRATVFLAGWILALGSCSLAPRPGHVQREWSRSLRQLGINPVFPPREDLQVGDVYLRRGDPIRAHLLETRGFVPIDLWLASVDLRRELVAFHGRRMAFPDTVTAPGSRRDSRDLRKITGIPSWSGEHPGQQPTVARNVFTENGWDRLRQVAFPDFTSLTLRGASLQGLVPVQALAVAFGAAWQGEQQVDVKIPAASSYGLPFLAVAARILEPAPDARSGLRLRDDVLPRRYMGLLRDHLRRWVEEAPDLTDEQRAALRADRFVYVDVVTEVFHARTIDLAISNAEAMGASLGVQPPAGSRPAGAPVLEGDPVSRAEQLNAWLERSGSGAPGGTFQFLAVSRSSVSMRRTYQRPVAIGFRGITLKVDPRTLEVAAIGSRSTGEAVTTMGFAALRTRIQQALHRLITTESGVERFAVLIGQTAQGVRITIAPRPDRPAWVPPPTRERKAGLWKRLLELDPGLASAVQEIGRQDATQRDLLEKLASGAFDIDVLDERP